MVKLEQAFYDTGAAKRLKFSGNNEMVYNPSAASVWLNVDDGKYVEVRGGATVNLND